LRRAALDPELGQRFFEQLDRARGEARIDPMLVEALLRHQYTGHVRELERLLWLSMGTSPGNFLAASPEVRAELSFVDAASALPQLGPQEIEAALHANDGNVTAATRALGLRNRFVLYRLIKRHGITLRGS
jgi:two-component system nitrogen regulation response regulator GlnG/two-component system response regulator HydG